MPTLPTIGSWRTEIAWEEICGRTESVGEQIQWNLTNPNSLGPELVQISEIFGLMKQYI